MIWHKKEKERARKRETFFSKGETKGGESGDLTALLRTGQRPFPCGEGLPRTSSFTDEPLGEGLGRLQGGLPGKETGHKTAVNESKDDNNLPIYGDGTEKRR